MINRKFYNHLSAFRLLYLNEYRRLGDLYTTKNILLTVLESRKSKSKAPEDSTCSEGLFPGSRCVLAGWKRQDSSLRSLLTGHWSHSWGFHPHNLLTFQRPHLQMPTYWGLRLPHMNFGWPHSVHSNNKVTEHNFTNAYGNKVGQKWGPGFYEEMIARKILEVLHMYPWFPLA